VAFATNVTLLRSSIAAFGGDASRITLFGQSAGGGSTEYYSYAWTADPIVSGFIVESGAGSGMSPGGSSTMASAPWWKISERVGCGGVEAGEKTLACMRAKPWKSILDVMEKRRVMPSGESGAFTPIADGKVVFSDVGKRRSEGKFIKAVSHFLILSPVDSCLCSLALLLLTVTLNSLSSSAIPTTKSASISTSPMP
jgi:cholinesterase